MRLPPRPAARGPGEKPITVKRITPLLFVADIEPCLEFWTERLGFENAADVKDGSKLAFVMLQKGGAAIMYQSYASVEHDVPAIASPARKGPSFLYIEVDNLDAIKDAVKGADVYMTERTTFYGAREIGVRDPAGHYVTFAEFAAQAE